MVKFILIKSPDEWATTKQACRDELVVYLFFSPIYIYIYMLFAVMSCYVIRSALGKTVPEVLGTYVRTQDRGHSFSQYGPT